jgi:bis(5'-nucleosyl)-tetraphosphatase (symmetrical)
MATYAIGDVQGCFDELQALLSAVRFDAHQDRVWFVGDLVNRGPKSLEVLRFVRHLGERAVVVLGNHDLHLVAQHAGCERARKDDTFQEVLGAGDCDELVRWLRTRPLMHVEGGYAMVHAGLLPVWSIAKARSLAKEVERALAGSSYLEFLRNMYGGKPERWDEALTGWDRLRVIVNAMTRMRFCTREGAMEFHAKGAAPPPGYLPWFETRPAGERETILCGHWSQLGLKLAPRLAALDSGCVWGGALSALKLEERSVHGVPCPVYQAPGGEA